MIEPISVVRANLRAHKAASGQDRSKNRGVPQGECGGRVRFSALAQQEVGVEAQGNSGCKVGTNAQGSSEREEGAEAMRTLISSPQPPSILARRSDARLVAARGGGAKARLLCVCLPLAPPPRLLPHRVFLLLGGGLRRMQNAKLR